MVYSLMVGPAAVKQAGEYTKHRGRRPHPGTPRFSASSRPARTVRCQPALVRRDRVHAIMPAMNFNLITLPELWRRTHYLFSRFNADRCSENAAALTYMSLFALVPLLTVVHTMASAVPAFQGLEAKMQGFLFEHLMPDTNSEIRTYLDDFSRQAKEPDGARYRVPGGHRRADAAQY